ncbi:MAG TPA: nuclear transport factor 2 family protein [Amycolatopsis sp.]
MAVEARTVEELVARQQIEALLARRGRAADAKDPDAILAEHVPGSADEHGIFDGTIEQFVEYLRRNNYRDQRYGPQRHTVSNVLIDFDSPERARVESYHLAYHRLVLDSGAYDVDIGGRYLDVCECRDGRWLLRSRTVVYDWSRSSPATNSHPPQVSPGGRMTIDKAAREAGSPGLGAAVADLVARQRITELLYRRARAGDRRDVGLALSCYHPGATEEHEGFTGPAAEFVSEVSMISPNSTAPVIGLWHFISNILIDLNGDSADVESYHIAVVIREADGVRTQSRIGGRYLDTMAFRDGYWGIVHRAVVFDWSRVDEATLPYWELAGLDESKLLTGKFGADDPLYSHLKAARG